MQHSDKIAAALIELEEVLAVEHQALRSLDRDAIERAGVRKLELDQRLRDETHGTAPRAEHLDSLIRVKRAALQNQLLLVHARASVQSVLSMVAGEEFSAGTYPGGAPTRAAPPPLRVNFRG